MEVVCGLDVGTSGAKALAVDPNGAVVAKAEHPFDQPPYQPAAGLAEQDANEWWKASCRCLQQLSHQLPEAQIAAIAVDSTSGTIVPIDCLGNPLMPALMYNDGRGQGLEASVNAAAADFIDQFGYQFTATFALVKWVWLQKHHPEILAQTYKFLHAADFLVGRLTGQFDFTDTSNALKSGVDLLTGEWSSFIEDRLGLPLAKFPTVLNPGEWMGELSVEAAAQTGLKAGIPVVAGASDGTAAFLASGAKHVGDWNITIGTTIAIRGIAEHIIRDTLGRYYCHRHPEGHWLPGGASNTGGEALVKTFGAAQLAELDGAARSHLPTQQIVYPLVRTGERMPFVSPVAEGFKLGVSGNDEENFAAYLEGIGMVAAWSIQEVHALGAAIGGQFYLSGGGAQGKTLGTILASLLQKELIVPEHPEAAMGSALLAAGRVWHHGSVSHAQATMIHRASTFEPQPAWIEPMQAKLQELQGQCRQRGYL